MDLTQVRPGWGTRELQHGNMYYLCALADDSVCNLYRDCKAPVLVLALVRPFYT